MSIDEILVDYMLESDQEKAGYSESMPEAEDDESEKLQDLEFEALEVPRKPAMRQIRHAVKSAAVERLGLGYDATDEEIKEALDARRELEIEKAIGSGDYDTWKALIRTTHRGKELAGIISREKFPAYAEMMKNLYLAEEIANELGLTFQLKSNTPA